MSDILEQWRSAKERWIISGEANEMIVGLETEIEQLRLDLYKATIRMEADDDLIGQLQFAANDEIARLREALRYMIENPEDLESFHRIASVALGEGK